MSAAIIQSVPIIDADTHLVEPPDLWTSRMSEQVGRPRPPRSLGRRRGRGGVVHRATSGSPPCGAAAQAGWPEYPPDHPPRWTRRRPDDLGPRAPPRTAWTSTASTPRCCTRTWRCSTPLDPGIDEPELQLEFVRAYNDYQTEFCSAAPDRLCPSPHCRSGISRRRSPRSTGARPHGHRGIVFTQDPSAFGLPALTDRHWDPMWASAQEKGLPVNFHIASGDMTLLANAGHPDNGAHANYASMGVSFFMGNARTIAQLICGGICHRFPDLNFVSVESGVGWIPFALEALDWQWKNCGVRHRAPGVRAAADGVLPPSDLRLLLVRARHGALGHRSARRRQLPLRDRLPPPDEHVARPGVGGDRARRLHRKPSPPARGRNLRKILHDNAARIYHLD